MDDIAESLVSDDNYVHDDFHKVYCKAQKKELENGSRLQGIAIPLSTGVERRGLGWG